LPSLSTATGGGDLDTNTELRTVLNLAQKCLESAWFSSISRKRRSSASLFLRALIASMCRLDFKKARLASVLSWSVAHGSRLLACIRS
jgi:hypothetical protein